jgi:hypothetical protein
MNALNRLIPFVFNHKSDIFIPGLIKGTSMEIKKSIGVFACTMLLSLSLSSALSPECPTAHLVNYLCLALQNENEADFHLVLIAFRLPDSLKSKGLSGDPKDPNYVPPKPTAKDTLRDSLLKVFYRESAKTLLTDFEIRSGADPAKRLSSPEDIAVIYQVVLVKKQDILKLVQEPYILVIEQDAFNEPVPIISGGLHEYKASPKPVRNIKGQIGPKTGKRTSIRLFK